MTYIALLRGINVGGKNLIRMTELASLFEEAGLRNVRTYIQSGNVIFEDRAGRQKILQQAISEKIQSHFNLIIPVVVLDQKELSLAVASNPFPDAVLMPKLLHVLFLSQPAEPHSLQKLNPLRSPGDEFKVSGRFIYLKLAAGAADTKLTNAYFDSTLKVTTTGRNWQTVMTLLQLSSA